MDDKVLGQLNLFSKQDSSSSSASEAFACCSRYRECSDARKCLISHLDYSVNCAYRNILESGNVLYGKNATHFSADTYTEIVKRINDLPNTARIAFDKLAIDFCENHRGVNRLVVRNEHIAKLSSVGIFEFIPLGSEFPALCGYNSYLRPLIAKSPIFKLAQSIREEELKPLRDAIKAVEKGSSEETRLKKELAQLQKEKPGGKTQDFMNNWLNHEGIEIRNFMADPYRFALCRPGLFPYLEEYYRDTLFSGCETRIYTPSPLAEDGILSTWDSEEEELRRVKVSRGYSADEKALRVKRIEDARAERKAKKEEANSDLEQSASDSTAKRRKKKEKPQNLFLGKMCVITGTLSRPRADAFFDILRCGGHISDIPVSTMDILVIGRQEWSELNNGIASRKIQKAIDLRNNGKSVQLMSEDEFNTALAKAFESA